MLFVLAFALSPGIWGIMMIAGLCIASPLFLFPYVRRSAKVFRAYAQEQGFTLSDKLPSTLHTPTDENYRTSRVNDCYMVVRRGFEAAIFMTRYEDDEDIFMDRTMVAVRRPPFGDLRLPQLLAKRVTIDATSSPGWVVASMKGGSMRPEVIEALLQALTVPSPQE
jgi:hypothetical protein